MLLSNNTPLLFLIVIAINKFVEGETISEAFESDRKCKKACDKYLNDKPTVINSEVFDDLNRASSTSFPHNCVLRSRNETYFRCGGSLISDQWILTAASCSRAGLGSEVVLGTDDLSANDSAVISITERFVHPNYKESSRHNDIALLKLEHSVKFTSQIYPACLFLDKNELAEETDLFLPGFGKLHLFKPPSDLLNLKRLKVSPHNLCYEKYKNLGYEIISSQICANGITYGACGGDAGGPLQLWLNGDKKIASVVGIVSYGVGCLTETNVYTRVSSYLDWIEEHVWPEDF